MSQKPHQMPVQVQEALRQASLRSMEIARQLQAINNRTNQQRKARPPQPMSLNLSINLDQNR